MSKNIVPFKLSKGDILEIFCFADYPKGIYTLYKVGINGVKMEKQFNELFLNGWDDNNIDFFKQSVHDTWLRNALLNWDFDSICRKKFLVKDIDGIYAQSDDECSLITEYPILELVEFYIDEYMIYTDNPIAINIEENKVRHKLSEYSRQVRKQDEASLKSKSNQGTFKRILNLIK